MGTDVFYLCTSESTKLVPQSLKPLQQPSLGLAYGRYSNVSMFQSKRRYIHLLEETITSVPHWSPAFPASLGGVASQTAASLDPAAASRDPIVASRDPIAAFLLVATSRAGDLDWLLAAAGEDEG